MTTVRKRESELTLAEDWKGVGKCQQEKKGFSQTIDFAPTSLGYLFHANCPKANLAFISRKGDEIVFVSISFEA